MNTQFAFQICPDIPLSRDVDIAEYILGENFTGKLETTAEDNG
jgi:hypothetical protein